VRFFMIVRQQKLGLEPGACKWSNEKILSALQGKTAVKRVAGCISAALQLNGLEAAQGYDAFDLDEDSVLSLQDLVDASEALDLNLPADHLAQFLAFVEATGGGNSAEHQRKGWQQVLSEADGGSVLEALNASVLESC
jgi:hypothetical protein